MRTIWKCLIKCQITLLFEEKKASQYHCDLYSDCHTHTDKFGRGLEEETTEETTDHTFDTHKIYD